MFTRINVPSETYVWSWYVSYWWMYLAIPRALFSTFSQIQQSDNTVNPFLACHHIHCDFHCTPVVVRHWWWQVSWHCIGLFPTCMHPNLLSALRLHLWSSAKVLDLVVCCWCRLRQFKYLSLRTASASHWLALLGFGIGDGGFLDAALVCFQLAGVQIYFRLCVYIYKAQLKFLIWLSAVGVDRGGSSICCYCPLPHRTDWCYWGPALTTGFLTLPWFVPDLVASKSTFGFAFTSIKLS
jgi:hypothetical protein